MINVSKILLPQPQTTPLAEAPADLTQPYCRSGKRLTMVMVCLDGDYKIVYGSLLLFLRENGWGSQGSTVGVVHAWVGHFVTSLTLP